MTQEELNKIIDDHQHWLKKDCDGWESMRADLNDANLYGANLSHANLYGANLSGANLSGVNLYDANLYDANLYGAKIDRTTKINLPISCPSHGEFIG